MGSYSYTSHDDVNLMDFVSFFIIFFNFLSWEVSLTHPVFVSFVFFGGGVSITHPVLASFYLGSFSYTSHAGLIFIWGVSLTHPILALFFCGEFVLHIPMLALIISGDYWLYCSVANFSYTSHATFIFVPGVCLTHPVLPSFLCREFLLHIPTCLHFYAGSFSYISYAGFLLCGEFLLHIPR